MRPNWATLFVRSEEPNTRSGKSDICMRFQPPKAATSGLMVKAIQFVHISAGVVGGKACVLVLSSPFVIDGPCSKWRRSRL